MVEDNFSSVNIRCIVEDFHVHKDENLTVIFLRCPTWSIFIFALFVESQKKMSQGQEEVDLAENRQG